MPIDTDIPYKKERIAKIIINRPGPGNLYSIGTAFPLGETGRYLTCFHVIFGKTLKELRSGGLANLAGGSEHDKLTTYQGSNIAGIQLQLSNGSFINATLNSFDEKYDAATISITGRQRYSLEIDTESEVDIGDQVFFCGFQHAVGIEPRDFPFTVNSGFVSTIVDAEVGGEKYKHLQINSINLGGNSGAPVFRADNNEVIGIINGNMNWGRDDVAIVDSPNTVKKDSLRVPLSIAYATPLKLLRQETDLLPVPLFC